MKTFTTVALAAALMATTSAPLMAQGYNSSQSQYQRNQTEYDSSYRAYQAAREQYERDKADYDRRYGSGAYDRYYSQGSWRGDRWESNDRRNQSGQYGQGQYGQSQYGQGQYGQGQYGQTGQYGQNNRNDPYERYRDSPCERQAGESSRDRTTGTVLGALIGGALGATAAGDNSEGKGAVLGAIVGGVIGNQVAGSSSNNDRYAAQCDANGYYYTFEQTQPYREDTTRRGQRSGQYDSSYYARQRCRLAVAPAQWDNRTDYRYVRVCPDRQNRYRITG